MKNNEVTFNGTPDQVAAHLFLTELRTRIASQPLPYQHGVEARALGSMRELFDHARAAIKQCPGCERVAGRVTEILNLVVRPFTAKWHRALEGGLLDGRDGADSFRGELQIVQEELRKFACELHEIAYGVKRDDALTPDVMSGQVLTELFMGLSFGFSSPSGRVESEVVKGIRADELSAITYRRRTFAITTAEGIDAIGFALSGGGIRSATFSLGVVQVLAEKGFLKEVDFLSTVSGGGYTGCFLTQRLGDGADQAVVASPHGPDPDPIRYLRQHAQYLSIDSLKAKWAMVTATLAGMVLNWTAPLAVIAVLAVITEVIGATGVQVSKISMVGTGLLCLPTLMVYGWSMRYGEHASRRWGQALGTLLAMSVVSGITWQLDHCFRILVDAAVDDWRVASIWGGLSALAAAIVPGVMRFLPVLKEAKKRKLVLKVALWLAGILVPVCAILVFYAFRLLGHDHIWLVAVISAVCALISALVLDINLTGPHRLYRNSLARTFIQMTEGGEPNVPLAEINPRGTAPYHLINATLNIPSSESPSLKDRGCDFFMFSKAWTGAASTGYLQTSDWNIHGAPMQLATAMAVSGAAFSPHMGLGSKPTLAALLAILNVRLNFWIKRPPSKKHAAPGFMCLFKEILGAGMSEKATWLNLSDGGHIENLAIYELLRRRCKFIVCVDGESDPTFTFQGLMTAVRHAQIDFGIEIKPNLSDIRPDPDTGCSRSHYHLCRIHYPEGVGLLLYIKLSVTGNESELIKRYRINNPDFPHQTTLDQFFNQEQFEAYRQLGVHAAEGLYLPALLSGTQPKSVPDWFLQLAKNLLEPA